MSAAHILPLSAGRKPSRDVNCFPISEDGIHDRFTDGNSMAGPELVYCVRRVGSRRAGENSLICSGIWEPGLKGGSTKPTLRDLVILPSPSTLVTVRGCFLAIATDFVASCALDIWFEWDEHSPA